MSWLERWKAQPKDAQATLFGEEEALVQQQRLTGAISNNRLKAEVEQRGGNQTTQRAVNAIVTIEMLDCTPDELYRATGGKRGNRATVPLEAQEALQTGDIGARHEIIETDAQGDAQIKEAAHRGAKRARQLFPW
jgi:hypothetical protein